MVKHGEAWWNMVLLNHVDSPMSGQFLVPIEKKRSPHQKFNKESVSKPEEKNNNSIRWLYLMFSLSENRKQDLLFSDKSIVVGLHPHSQMIHVWNIYQHLPQKITQM